MLTRTGLAPGEWRNDGPSNGTRHGLNGRGFAITAMTLPNAIPSSLFAHEGDENPKVLCALCAAPMMQSSVWRHTKRRHRP